MQCLKSVFKANYPNELLEVILVAGGSTDGSVEASSSLFPKIKIIETLKNLGFCMGNNVGIKKASGDLVILLDNDTIVDKNWFNEIVAVSNDPQIGIIGCRLYYPETKIIQSLVIQTKFVEYWASIGAGQEDIGQFKDITAVEYVSGAALAFKREVLNKIGVLDSHFYEYVED